jgi:hypothetical protein
LERYEVSNRTRSGLNFILVKLSYLNLLKVGIGSIDAVELLILELLPFGGFTGQFNLAGLYQRK